MKKYNEIIRELREDRDLTQTEIAKVLNVSQTAYSKYEMGNGNLPMEYLKTLCKYYNVSSNYILGLPNLPYPED